MGHTVGHTVGPWRACYSDQIGSGNIRSDHHRDGRGALLLEAGPMFHGYTPDRDEEMANLRLAASAPELLAALEQFIEFVAFQYVACDIQWHIPVDDTQPDAGVVWNDAFAAVAKATGRPYQFQEGGLDEHLHVRYHALSKDGIEQAQDAFQEALESGRLSLDEAAPNWVGNYMFMGTNKGRSRFKHRDSRQYLEEV